MQQSLQHLPPGLQDVLRSVAATVVDISALLREGPGTAAERVGTHNEFGDAQLQLDCDADEIIFSRLQACSACCAASSEEQPEMKELNPVTGPQGVGYTVVFDPLDGSSIVGAGFAVGSIYGVWPGKGVVGRSGREQVAAAYAVYGPRTILVWAFARPDGSMRVQQWVLGRQNEWQPLPFSSVVQQQPTQSQLQQASSEPSNTASHTQRIIAPTKPLFAPANLRCCLNNKVYRQLVDTWVDRGFTLRYTGGMVPDVHHILAKGGGVFVNPASAAAPAKLRLVYECAPLALIIEAAGGASSDGHRSVLDIPVTATTQRTTIVLGSTDLVTESLPALAFVDTSTGHRPSSS